MSTHHHPSDDLLTAFAGGTLDRAQQAVTATHIAHCPACRAAAAALEHVGGELVAGLPPAALSPQAFRRVEARLDTPAAQAVMQPAPTEWPGLPGFVRRMPASPWTWLAPGLDVKRLDPGDGADTRLFLLRSRAGAKFLPHTHTGFEMTCVLTGSFSHGDARYAAGDFDFGTPEVEHRIEIGGEGPCVSLVAMQGMLKLGGFLGRVLQPLIRL